MNLNRVSTGGSNGTLLQLLMVYIAMLFFDAIWIVYIAGPLYHAHFPELIALKLFPAFIFYILFGGGLFYFSLLKNPKQSLGRCLFDASLFGVCVYGGYAFTLLSVFNFWRLDLALLELIWGGLLSFLVVLFSILVSRFQSKHS